MDLEPADVEIPEGAIIVREIRLVQYEYPDSPNAGGIAIGVEAENGFDVIATLGILTMASAMLMRDGEL